MSTIFEILNEQPELHARILELAAVGKDETKEPATRMAAYYEVSRLMAPLTLEAAIRDFTKAAEAKPKPVWRNGALVKPKKVSP